MTQQELPLYPKLSSIYNKIMQLAIAIVLIIVLMNMWISTHNHMKQSIEQQFTFVAEQYLDQTANGVSIFVDENREQLQVFIDGMAQSEWVEGILVYDDTGLTIAANHKPDSINDLFGISAYRPNVANEKVSFVREIAQGKFEGYVRVTLAKKAYVSTLNQASQDHYDLLRLMMIMAGGVGFLLTRGLNRFSRQGYRLPKDQPHSKASNDA
ncbi:AhpA/YtjB family protein [Thalassotalea fusca]